MPLKQRNQPKPFPEDVSLSWWKLPQSLSFSFNEIMYRQTDGFSMGSPLGPILANILVGFHERLLFEKFHMPFIYLHYVDDTFVTFSSRNDALLFFHKMDDLHPSLSFTMGEEKSNKLSFLDVLIERYDFSFLTFVNRKPTFTGLFWVGIRSPSGLGN